MKSGVKIRNFNAAVITDTIKKATGNPVKIADKQEEEKLTHWSK